MDYFELMDKLNDMSSNYEYVDLKCAEVKCNKIGNVECLIVKFKDNKCECIIL